MALGDSPVEAGPADVGAPLVPESAPFSAEQRAWLNGVFEELLASHAVPANALSAVMAALATPQPRPEAMPWHKPKLSLDERMMLAHGRPMNERMMAALGQEDCRRCGYDCATYADALAAGAETRLNLCIPGGKATERLLKTLIGEMQGGASAFDAEAYKKRLAEQAAPKPPDKRPGYCREHPLQVRLISRERLSAPDSEKETYHLEIGLEDTALTYEPGDALGVYPENEPAIADAVLAAINAPADFPIMDKTLREVLIQDVSLGVPPDSLFDLISYITGGERRRKAKALARGEDPDGDADSLDVLAALEKFPGIRPDPEAFVESLDQLKLRYYSIASSLKAAPGRVALTVNHVRYVANGRSRQGVGSSWLAERAPVGAPLRAFIQQAPHFKLPEDDSAPIIMVGPGTGIAPFRAFLQERRAKGAKGPAWLFFGHRHETEEFFYKEDLEAFQKDGVLRRLSLAWSRDRENKAYVQDKMVEAGEELWDWLFDGAYIYVCGDAKHMAAGVEQALTEIVADIGNRDEDAARVYIENLKQSGRYRMDVY